MITILLVDDQNLVQQGIKSLLDQDSRFKVVGTVRDGRSAIRQINLLRPDIVLLDIEMPGMNGISVTKYINHFMPATKVMILSSHEEKKYVVQALVAGAKAYILKNSLMADLKQAILAVDNGYSQVESKLLVKVFNPSNIKPPISLSKPNKPQESKQAEISQSEEQPQKLLSRPSSFFAAQNEQKHQQHQETNKKHNHLDSDLDLVTTKPKTLPIQKSSFATTNQKTKIKLDYISKSTAESITKTSNDKSPVSLASQATLEHQELEHQELEHQKQTSDRLFYRSPQVKNKVQSNKSSQAIVLMAQPRTHSQPGIRFKPNYPQQLAPVLVTVKKHWAKFTANPEVVRYRSKLETLAQPVISRYQPAFNRYKTKTLIVLGQRDTQKLLQSVGLMVLGGIIVLIFHSL